MPIEARSRRSKQPAPCNRDSAPLMFRRRAGIRQEMTMGLLDVLNGMQNGPRGPSNPSAQTGGGMSPLTMAILGCSPTRRSSISAAASREPRRRRRHGNSRCNAGMPGRRSGRRSRRPAHRRIGRPARGRCRGQRDQRRPWRPAQAIPAERPWRHRQFMGRARARTSRFRRAILPARSAPIRSTA